jgi:hypothetical protein
MKIIAGVVVAGLLAGSIGLIGHMGPMKTSAPPARGGPLTKDYFAFVLPGGYLNGPRREAMDHRGGFNPAEADAKGNIYGVGVYGGTLVRCIRADGQVETITGDDFTMADFKLDEGPASALGTPPEGFTFGLAAPTLLMVEGAPADGEGKGHLLLAMKNQVFKIWKNAEKGNRWWFKRIIGGGKAKLPEARGQSVAALDAGFQLYGVQWDKDHKLILFTEGWAYKYDGDKLTCILSYNDYKDKALKSPKSGRPVAPRQFFLAADGSVYLGYYFCSDEAYRGQVPGIWRLSPDGSKAEPFAKNSGRSKGKYDGDALTEAAFYCGPHFGGNSIFNPPEIFLTAAHDEATIRRIKDGRTSRLCWDGEWREVPSEGGKQMIYIIGLTRGGPDTMFGAGATGIGRSNDYRMYLIKGIDFSKPTAKEGGQ